MSDADIRQFHNLLAYCGVAAANMLAIVLAAALSSGSLPGFREGEALAVAAPSMVALLAVVTPILSTWLASNRPRIGSEALAADVDKRRRRGQSRNTMVVGTAGVPLALDHDLTPDQYERIADILQSRMKATPAVRDGDS